MKILQINKYHYVRGGSDKMYFDTSQLLETNGHKVIHFSTKDSKNEASPTNDYFVENPCFLKLSVFKKLLQSVSYIYSWKAKRSLERLIKNEKPDLVHLHIFFGELSLSILPVIKRNNIPVVMTLHEYKLVCPIYTLMDSNGDICQLCSRLNYLPSIKKKCSKGSLGNSLVAAAESFIRDLGFPYEKYIDRFIAVSEFSKQKHEELRPALKGKIDALHNFVERDDLIGRKSNNYGYYLYFGRLSSEKGLITLIKAFSSLSHLKLRIVGDGPQKEELKAILKTYGSCNIELVGFKSGKDLKMEIAAAKYTIVPSEWYETFGLTVVESMLEGIPVISSGMGGMKELVKHNVTGFLFDSKNVESLIQAVKKAESLSGQQYLSMSEDCFRFASDNFEKEKYYQKLMAIYYQLIDHKNE